MSEVLHTLSVDTHVHMFLFLTVLGRSGVQPSAQEQYGVPTAADGGHEVSPLASAPALAAESPYSAPQSHGWSHVCCGWDGRYQR